jgi:putative molybdopterin biosynthesis protein
MTESAQATKLRRPSPTVTIGNRQQQFLDVIDHEEAQRRFHAALCLEPLETEEVGLGDALQRVLAQDVLAPVDVPGFDRSNVDGFALRAAETYGATEDRPCTLAVAAETIAPGYLPPALVATGTAISIATGAIIPRGADSVVIVEYTDIEGDRLVVRRPVAPGANITFAGTDIGRGETVLRRGDMLSSQETGVLAALGLGRVLVVRRPRVAILSTGNELIAPGRPLGLGQIYDSNATVLCDAVRELGADPVPLGIVGDDAALLRPTLKAALDCDLVILSGGTSKGAGDLSYRAVADLGPPGIIVHGVALKPGKPVCLAAVRVSNHVVPVLILPGFPTSMVFTFREFAAPLITRLGGREPDAMAAISARLPFRVNSERGRTEYLLVGLVQSAEQSQPGASDGPPAPALTAYPMGKGSGSVTAFARSDGFVTIPRQREYIEAGSIVEVRLIGGGVRPADFVMIGSHCIGADYLLGCLQERGFRTKFLAVGSTGGLEAARRGECDAAGIHLLDPATGIYNQPFLSDGLDLLRGYQRMQGVVFRQGDARFRKDTAGDAIMDILADATAVMVNRNRGSGTRVLIDRLVGQKRPQGYWIEARSHNAVAAAVAQGRADWGIAIAPVAEGAGLGFLPLVEENYDFVVPRSRWERPAVVGFRRLLNDAEVRKKIGAMGFR